MANFVYVPDGRDTEMGSLANQLNYFHEFNKLSGGERTLNQVSSSDRLYLLCHGHGEMPVFCLTKIPESGTKSWTAGEMADLLVSDRLSKQIKEMQLLVCHAGESVADIKEAQFLLNLRVRAKEANEQHNKKLYEKLRKQYDSFVKKKTPPKPFISEKQAFPLAAQLYRELYHRGFKKLRITSYKAPVAQYIPAAKKPFRPELDLTSKGGNWGESLDKHPDYVALYTAALFRRLGWSLNPKDIKQPQSCW